MKKLILLLFLSPLSFAQDGANKINFSLSCKVTGQVLIKTEDGISTKFSAFSDGLQDGDTFKIEFKLGLFNSGNYYLSILSTDIRFTKTLSSTETSYSSEKNRIKYGGSNSLTDSGSLRLNSILGNLALERYYKNDFELMHSQSSDIGEASRILTANCMNMPSEYDEAISIIMAIEADKKD